MDVASILQGDWEFRVEHKGITVHSSKVQGSDILGFKGVVDIPVPFRKMIALFHDTRSYRRWVHQLHEMDILRKEGLEYIVRQVINAPWPMPRREMIVRTRLEPAGENSVAVVMEGMADFLPEHASCKRVRMVNGAWIFAPLAEGDGVKLVFVMHIDPGNDVPSSLGNQAMFEVPFYTLDKLRALAVDSSYEPPYPSEVDDYLSISDDQDGRS